MDDTTTVQLLQSADDFTLVELSNWHSQTAVAIQQVGEIESTAFGEEEEWRSIQKSTVEDCREEIGS